MRKISAISLTATIATLSGCGIFSPSYHQPTIDAPTATRNGVKIESGNIESSTTDYSQLQWWKKVNDPVLNQLIILALSNNAQIQVAQGNIMKAQASLKAAQYAWIPTLNGVGGGFAGNSWATNLTPQGALAANPAVQSGNLANSNFSGLYGGFMPTYSFNVFANINQTKLAKATLDMQQAIYNATRLTIIGQVSGGYFTLLAQKKQLLLQQQMIADLKELRRLEMIQVQNGAADLGTIATYDQAITTYQAKIPAIENSISQTENALRVLINQNPGPIVTNGSIDKLITDNIIPANIPSSVLKSRPDIIQAEDSLKIANANVGLANSQFFPTISLTGFAGGISEALSNLFNVGTGFWMGSAMASMPILDASTYERVKAEKGDYYAQYYSYMQTVKSAFQNVDNSLTNKQNMDKVYAETYKSYQYANDYYKVNQVQFKAGNSPMNNVLQAKLNLDNAGLSLLQAKSQQLDAIVEVYQALAVGYAAESELSKPQKLPD